MGDKTKITWTDASWNPMVGCTKVSPGCDHCYADALATRFAGTGGYPNGFDLTLKPEKLALPFTWKDGRMIFVDSMSDLFHEKVPDEYIAQVFAVMSVLPRHTFQVLTKRHARMRSLLTSATFPDMVDAALSSLVMNPPPKMQGRITSAMRESAHHLEDGPLPNLWLGVSAEDQKWADIRIPYLLQVPAVVHFISAEPLLGPINLGSWLHLDPAEDGYPALDWVLVGGESGRGARRMDPEWARSLRDQCAAAGTAFLFKQTGVVLAKEWGIPGQGRDQDLADLPEPFTRAWPKVGA
jgi:protein gp37